MIVFTIQDTSYDGYDGCIGSITRAVQKPGPAASVWTDLATHRVKITSRRSAAGPSAAIDDAGCTVLAA